MENSERKLSTKRIMSFREIKPSHDKSKLKGDELFISIPFWLDLSDLKKWYPATEHQFLAIRVHLQLNEIVEENDNFAVIDITNNLNEQYNHGKMNIKSTLHEALVAYGVLDAIIGHFKERLNYDFLVYEDRLGYKIRAKLSELIINSTKSRLAEFTPGNMLHQQKEIIKKGNTDYLPLRKTYYNVYLSYIDFLTVDYRIGPFVTRNKKPLANPINHKNKICIAAPLAIMSFYNLSKGIFKRTENLIDKNEAQRVYFEQANGRKDFIYYPKFAYDGVPTLYRLSDSAFPIFTRDFEDKFGNIPRVCMTKVNLFEKVISDHAKSDEDANPAKSLFTHFLFRKGNELC